MDNDEELVKVLEFEYYSIMAANPDWESTFVEFLVSRGFSEKEALEFTSEGE